MDDRKNDGDTKALETQKDPFRGVHKAEDRVPSDRGEAPSEGSDSDGQRTEAPGARFPDPDQA